MNQQARLLRVLKERFNEEDLKALCFDIGIDYQMFAGRHKGEMVRELFLFCKRTGKIDALLAAIHVARPHVDLSFIHGGAEAEPEPEEVTTEELVLIHRTPHTIITEMYALLAELTLVVVE